MIERNESRTARTEVNFIEPDQDLAICMLRARIRNREALIALLKSMHTYESTNEEGLIRRCTRVIDTTTMETVQTFEKGIEARMRIAPVTEDLGH